MPDCISVMRSAFSALSSGIAKIPQRTAIDHPEFHGASLFMPGYFAMNRALGIKIVTLFADNREKGLPLINGVMLLFDATTGLPVALMDAEYLTAMRTGAASGLATDLLARKNAQSVVLFGAGKQGEFQLQAVCTVRTIKKIYVYDPDIQKSEAFCDKMASKLGQNIHRAEDAAIVQDADIICTATPSTQPVFEAAYVKPGTHINAIGSYQPQKSEIPADIVARARIVVDSRQAASSEAGEIVQGYQSGRIGQKTEITELGEIVIKSAPARTDEKEITLFKSVGNAIQDLETAQLVIKNALASNIGTYVRI